MVRASVLLVGIIILAVGALIAASSFGILPFELPIPAEITIGGMTLPIVAVGGLIAVIGLIIAIIGMRMF